MKIFRDANGACYHLKVKQNSLSPFVIICGAPERVVAISKQLETPRTLSENRGLLCMRGKYADIDITAVCTGMGPASTAIVLPEILDSIDQTAKRLSILRLGTAGALQPQVCSGHLVVATGAVRDEGTTRKIAPLEYPAIGNTKMHLAALAAAKGCGWKWHENLWSGIIHVKDELYFTESPEGSPLGQSRTALLEAYQQLGVLATEMEFSVLTILADLMNRREEKRHIDVGCIDLVASNYHDLHAAKSPSSPTVTFEHLDPNAAIEVALKTLQLKSCWDRGTELRQIDAVLHEI